MTPPLPSWIVPRDAWGATLPVRTDGSGRPVYVPLPAAELWAHHTVTIAHDADELVEATDDPHGDMRTIERIGRARFGLFPYSWVIHPNGTVMEGAGFTIGAHTHGRNSRSMAIAFIGNHDETTLQYPALVAGVAVTRWLLETGALARPLALDGHRNAPGAQTACPGLYVRSQLPELRRLALLDVTQPPEDEDMAGPLTEAVAAATFVEALYARVAQTNADAAGFDYWLGLLLTGSSPADVEQAFAGAVYARAAAKAAAAA